VTIWILLLLLVLAIAELIKPSNLGVARVLEGLVAVVAIVLIVLALV
jgi:hypothetical protein